MALRTMPSRLKAADLSIAKLPPKTADPRYRTTDWDALRQVIFGRDGHQCTAPGCPARAVVVDHVVSPRNGGSDDPANLRSLCRTHDNQVKEGLDGTRRGDGRFSRFNAS
ncbi:HNH endonuclease [Lichenihabitans sp. PAMC28606]|uniref:HNH endonuclease n=1 Tax=Lichenihabitans sp. PAMC28606 TaxID=2880932 RepID=UPI001D0B088E|nr:HNH endonuclease signature motif containing protein [Lichenihabitans sp. PAMC28606]UDL95629.1 HNH endonuclease [Lichenihabitans sp. PAMC28606]